MIPSAKDYEPVKVALENHSIINLTLEFVNQRLIDVEALMNDSKIVIKIIVLNSRWITLALQPHINKWRLNFIKRKIIHPNFVEWGLLNVLDVIEVGITSVIKDIRNLVLQQNTNEKHSAYEISFAAEILDVDKIIIDSGPTSHICSRKE